MHDGVRINFTLLRSEALRARMGLTITSIPTFGSTAAPPPFLADYNLKIKADYPHCTVDNLWGYFAGYRGDKRNGLLTIGTLRMAEGV